MFSESWKMSKETEAEPAITIPESEIELSFSRSGGPGGQNVNKVETKVTVRWNFQQSAALNETQKQLIAEKLKNRVNEDGELIVSAQSERSQAQNKQRALEILNDLVSSALTVPAERIPTKIPKSAKEKRLREKKIQSEKKALREKFDY